MTTKRIMHCLVTVMLWRDSIISIANIATAAIKRDNSEDLKAARAGL